MDGDDEMTPRSGRNVEGFTEADEKTPWASKFDCSPEELGTESSTSKLPLGELDTKPVVMDGRAPLSGLNAPEGECKMEPESNCVPAQCSIFKRCIFW